MDQRTTLEIIAPTVEEALAQGLEQLGLTADAVSVEVLDSGTKGFLGLGGRQVRVKLTVNGPGGSDESPAPKPRENAKAKSNADRKPESAPRKKDAEKSPALKKNAPEPSSKKAIFHEHDSVLETTESMISKMISLLGMQAQVSAHYDDDSTDERRSIQVDVRGDDLSALIGRRAETLSAFQHVASLMVGKTTDKWISLTVDVEGYRARREKQIRQLANRMADQVSKTGRKVTMEPMPADERRIVHIELRGHPVVRTESAGAGPNRKVVILPKE